MNYLSRKGEYTYIYRLSVETSWFVIGTFNRKIFLRWRNINLEIWHDVHIHIHILFLIYFHIDDKYFLIHIYYVLFKKYVYQIIFKGYVVYYIQDNYYWYNLLYHLATILNKPHICLIYSTGNSCHFMIETI